MAVPDPSHVLPLGDHVVERVAHLHHEVKEALLRVLGLELPILGRVAVGDAGEDRLGLELLVVHLVAERNL